MRRTLAIAAARTAGALSRRLGRGGGTALPGLIAERLDPQIIAGLAAQLGHGSVLVTGTNGKTTTSRLLRNIAEAAALRPVANQAGSNMMRGIAAALAGAARWNGRLPAAGKRIGVFEVDEATLRLAADALRPRAVLFTNLFRDQLDRYGEVETVAAVWRETLARLPDTVTAVLNADDPAVASLVSAARGPVVLYGVELPEAGPQKLEHAADARWCSACGAELAYEAVAYGHLGRWSCPACGLARPQPQVVCSQAIAAPGGLRLAIDMGGAKLAVSLPLVGLYNAYNVVAAVAAAVALGLPPAAIEKGLGAFTAAFGRQERLRVAGRDVEVILAKNPAGLNQVLKTITANGAQKDLALFLNDNIADGRDISWIWDVDFELLSGKTRAITVSGGRAWDMALRLKYAGLEPPLVEPETARALRRALKATPEGQTLYVIPTYTAMLQVRGLLARWAGRSAFWQR